MANLTIESLKKVLADSFALSLKTQNYHWNVEAPNFKELHMIFEEQYQELAAAVDVIAEMIRAHKEKTPASFEAFASSTVIKSGNINASAKEMVLDLANDNELIQKTLTETMKSAQSEGNEVVANLMIERLTVHQKAAWMLNSSK